ncbi:CDP-alcohol phosphatidyltransferase family protein [Monashia sp. NPDC004114]
MRAVVPGGAVIGFIGAAGLLGTLHATVGLGTAGWAVGLASSVALCLLLAAGLMRRAQPRLGPADRITLTRAVLACAVAALTADSFEGPPRVATLVGLAALALVLDVVDGRVARRTGTASPLGARFDMESDAFLILVLSVFVSQQLGWWVLMAGAARYALLVAAWLAPWLSRPIPPKHWRKAVAGVQGVVLTVAAAGVLAPNVTALVLLTGLGLLAASFGTQVATLWRTRSHYAVDDVQVGAPDIVPGAAPDFALGAAPHVAPHVAPGAALAAAQVKAS